MGREFFLYVQAMLEGSKEGWYKKYGPEWQRDLNKLCKGKYLIQIDEEEADET
tara:strand:- start:469 stop:627 length:159 start_codon:yes stop_codon:yes gene_type:complete